MTSPPSDAVVVTTVAPTVQVGASRAQRVGADAKLIGLLALGHLVVDTNQGALPALLPFVKAAHGLSYAAVGAIVLIANVVSSLIQPLFGYLSDRVAQRWLLPLGVAVSGLGLAVTGLMPGYATVVAAIVVAGLGVAAYHPEAYKTTTAVAGDRKATAVSWFSLGGNIGIAIGPPLITVLVTAFGLAGSLGMIIPSLLVAGLLTTALPFLSADGAAKARSGVTAAVRNMPGAMALLIVVVMIRSWTQLGFTTFVPFYYVDYLKADPRVVGTLLFVFLGAGATGTLVAGPLADRFGPRRVLAGVFLLVPPLSVLFLMVTGLLAFVVLGAVGFVLVSSFTIAVVLGQGYMPRHQGLASGLIAGFAFGAGGLGVTALGWVADHWGLPSALWISALLPLAGFAVAVFLPEPKPR